MSALYDNVAYEGDPAGKGDIMLTQYDPLNTRDPNAMAKSYYNSSQPKSKSEGDSVSDDDATTSSFRRQSTCRIVGFVLLVFFLICVIVAAIVLAVVLTRSDDDDDDATTASNEPFRSSLKLDRTYDSRLADPSSGQYSMLEMEVCDALAEELKKGGNYPSGTDCKVDKFL
ncbi:hypothetical protein BsWGS_03604 [Bradybaena similaris]